MRTLLLVSMSMLVTFGCSSADDTPASTPGTDSAVVDTAVVDTGASPDTETPVDSAPTDTGADAPGCPASWSVAPAVDPSIEVPDGGGNVLLHASATGTQNYACVASTPADAGADGATDGGETTYAWTLTGPEADLKDCMMAKIATHFASDGGAPEWQTTDGTYVIGSRKSAFTPDGGSGAIPWLLLQATAHSGTGTLSKALYVQRVNTTGGKAPATGCDSTTVGATTKVSYTADYYFYGTP
jgi:hypothetical protein